MDQDKVIVTIQGLGWSVQQESGDECENEKDMIYEALGGAFGMACRHIMRPSELLANMVFSSQFAVDKPVEKTERLYDKARYAEWAFVTAAQKLLYCWSEYNTKLEANQS